MDRLKFLPPIIAALIALDVFANHSHYSIGLLHAAGAYGQAFTRGVHNAIENIWR